MGPRFSRLGPGGLGSAILTVALRDQRDGLEKMANRRLVNYVACWIAVAPPFFQQEPNAVLTRGVEAIPLHVNILD